MTVVRYVSGIQPSGQLHLGNYFGALADQRALASDDAYYFVADLHALAAGRDPAGVEEATMRAVGGGLAVGLAATDANLFRQSDVGEILQLQWLLGTVVRLEDLEVDSDVRARREREAVVTASRAGYSLLMAADIIAHQASHVIIGADQEQHLRMVRQYARALNRRCGAEVVNADIQRVPERRRPIILGRGGDKMSKSSGNGLAIRAARSEIATFVATLHESGVLPVRAEDCVLVNLMRHVDETAAEGFVVDYEDIRRDPARVAAMRDRLIESLDQLIGAWRPAFEYYDSAEGLAEVAERLETGAEAARTLARETVRIVRAGLRTPRPVGRGRPAPATDPGQPSPLSYSDYINVPALIGSLAPPADPPKGVSAADWPWGAYAPSIAAHGGGTPPSVTARSAREPWRRADLPTDHPSWAHDEVLFISVHQAFEIWFRHMLWEIDDLMDRVHSALAERGVHFPGGKSPVPHAELMRRRPERAARMHFDHTLRAHPRLSALVDRIEWEATEGDPQLREYADWIRETPRPGAFPDEISMPEFRLAWVADQFPTWTARLERVSHILETSSKFYDILAHMPPKSFLEFRGRLDPASGFGSGQFRELGIVTGQRERHFTKFGTLGPSGEVVDEGLWALISRHVGDAQEAAELAARATPILERALPTDQFEKVRARMFEPTLRDLAMTCLLAGVGGADHRRALADRVAAANLTDLYETGKRRRTHGFAHTEREREMWRVVGGQLSHMESVAATAVLADDPAFAEGDLDDAGRREFKRFLEECLRLDQAIMGWRIEHLSFVEAMIGARPGTGGGGLVYLQETMRATSADYALRSFPPVWAARSLIVNR